MTNHASVTNKKSTKAPCMRFWLWSIFRVLMCFACLIQIGVLCVEMCAVNVGLSQNMKSER